MSIEDDISLLSQVPTLAMLGPQALRILAIGTESRYVPSGQVLFYAGDPADGGYVIQDGQFLLEPGTPADGHEEITAGPGTLLGELALMTDTVRPATATALEPSTVIRISRNLFMKMLEGYPSAAKKLRDLLAERVDQWTREITNVKRVLDIPDERG
ncbi:MAG TPA: cyclic nucleotide-binding domain-containing protein [Pseudolabrys sp.]|nr:cyclic nucleotide-binding domain-containing protein [Pseudolabrys sp.]